MKLTGVILQTFAHLTAVGGEDETVDDQVFVGRLIKERRREHSEGVEPSSCLPVHQKAVAGHTKGKTNGKKHILIFILKLIVKNKPNS